MHACLNSFLDIPSISRGAEAAAAAKKAEEKAKAKADAGSSCVVHLRSSQSLNTRMFDLMLYCRLVILVIQRLQLLPRQKRKRKKKQRPRPLQVRDKKAHAQLVM